MLCSFQRMLPPNSVPAAESFSSFVRVQRRLLIILYVKPPNFLGVLLVGRCNFVDYVETTGFNGANHAVETMDADIEAPSLLSEDTPW